MSRISRSLLSVTAVAALAAGTVSFSAATAQATRDRTLRAASTELAASTGSHRVALSDAARAILAAPAGPGDSGITNLGGNGWEVQSSAVATQTGAQISTPGFSTSTWLPVTNDDAGAPGTEIEALAQNGLCPGDGALQPVNQGTGSPSSVFFSNNMQLCYGFASKIGPVSVSQFSVPWWWRTTSPRTCSPASLPA